MHGFQHLAKERATSSRTGAADCRRRAVTAEKDHTLVRRCDPLVMRASVNEYAERIGVNIAEHSTGRIDRYDLYGGR
jgi:hypothetical protein